MRRAWAFRLLLVACCLLLFKLVAESNRQPWRPSGERNEDEKAISRRAPPDVPLDCSFPDIAAENALLRSIEHDIHLVGDGALRRVYWCGAADDRQGLVPPRFTRLREMGLDSLLDVNGEVEAHVKGQSRGAEQSRATAKGQPVPDTQRRFVLLRWC